ncbi:MAG TPA: EI24 domain-containing protein [Ginsengibacter sp.]
MLEEIIIAIRSYFKAHHFIVKHKLWKWILIPGIIYAILFAFGIYIFWQSSAHVIDYFFSKTGLKIWLQKEHDSWLRFIFIFGQLILQLILMLVYFSWFKYLFLIIGSPVFAWLSEKTEAIMSNTNYTFEFSRYVSDIRRGVQIALRNLLWQTVYSVTILFLALVPLIGWASPVLAVFVECYYFGFSMLDYTSGRKGLPSSESIDYIGDHRGLAIGNGMVFFVMHVVPFAGWVLAPGYAVVAATLSFQESKN